MFDPILETGMACTYGAAAREAFRHGHFNLGLCYLALAAFAAGLALCRFCGV